METYISKNKFQFITDFGKHAYLDVKGNEHELNFTDLSISERIMLSSYLTFLCCNEDNKLKKKNDLYKLIFDFNDKNKKKTSYQDAFIEDLSNFIARQPYYFAFIKSHYNEIVNDKTFIYRQQLNHSEMELLYSLKFQRNYHSLMNVLYIIGVAKQNITSAYLNKIPLTNIYSHTTLAKKRVEEIFTKINSVSSNEVKYTISNGILYFGNGFFIEEDEKYQSIEKQQFNKLQAEEEIINNLLVNNKTNVDTKFITNSPNEIKVSKIITPELKDELDQLLVYEESKNSSPIDIGEARFTSDVFTTLKEKIQEDSDYLARTLEKYFNSENEKTIFFRKLIKDINNPITKIAEDKRLKEVKNFINNPEHPFPNDSDWKVKKDIAKENLKKLAKPIYRTLEKYYDEDKKKYEAALLLIYKNYEKLIKAIQIAETSF